ncbi:hypothetical protein JCM3770_004552 [Rhodotorula araucariae]
MSGSYSTQSYDHPPVPAHAYPPVSLEEMQAGLAATSHGAYPKQPAFVHRDSGYPIVPAESYGAEHYSHAPYEQPGAYTSSYRLPATPISPPFPSPPPVSGAPPYSAATLLQQHQENQHAFRSGGAGAHIFQNLATRGSESPVMTASGNTSTPSSHGSTATPLSSSYSGGSEASTSQQPPLSSQDADFAQTFYDPFRIKHRRRTSPPQLKVLEYHFERNPKPDVGLRKALSEQLDMTPREVQVWFQNRRAKVKKLKEKAEREAAAAAADGTASAEAPPELPVPPAALTALNASSSMLSVPLAIPVIPHLGRTIYGEASRRSSSLAVNGAPPTPFEHPFQPVPTAQPFIPLPPPLPPTGPSALSPYDAAVPYPSPLSSGMHSATPSPNDFLGQPTSVPSLPPPLPHPSYLDGALSASPARRLSLPAHSLYPEGPQQPSMHALAPSTQAPLVQLATSAPSAATSYFDQLAPASVPAHPVMLDGLGMSTATDPSQDGTSPTSSFGEPPLWGDPASQQQQAPHPPPERFSPVHRGIYAPQVPSALGRRASCPSDAVPDQYGQHGYGAPQWSPEYPSAPPPPQAQFAPLSAAAVHDVDHAGSATSPFYGYSFAPASAPAPVSATHTPPYGRRGSFVGLAPIAEQDAYHNDSGAGFAVPQPQPSPPGAPDAVPGGRRGSVSVVRRQRSGGGNVLARSPYSSAAAAATRRRSPTASDDAAL